MGDRVLFQVKGLPGRGFGKHDTEISPVVYGHWHGSYTPDILRRLQERMKGREGDVPYTAVRLVQEVCNGDKGNLSVGMWNADKLLTAEDSHGDAGVVIVTAGPGGLTFECLGGYLHIGSDGLPRHPRVPA